MAYAAITSLITTLETAETNTSSPFTLFYLQEKFMEKLKSFRAILEKPCNITGDLEVLTMMEAEIIELLNTTEDMVILKTRRATTAKTKIKRIVAFWKLYYLLKLARSRIDSKMNRWLAMQNRYTNSKDLRAQNLTVANTSQHDFESENVMVGHENAFEIMQDQLARGATELQVISIVGMGGIGKSTLAIKLYNDPFIMSHFDIRAKVIVSQEYCKRNVLLRLLSSISGSGSGSIDEEQDDGQLADRLQKHLKGKRYLIVIDDIWAKEAWDDIKQCFPDCNYGSRILLTTRNMKVAEYASSGKPPYQMRLLNFNESWNLLHKKLVRLWAAEGFLKVEWKEWETKIEEVAEQYIKDLVDRGLIFIHYLSFDRKIKACGMHDLIRELCLREAHKINFVNVTVEDQKPCEHSRRFFTKRRICIQSEESSFVSNRLSKVRQNKARSILLFIRNPSSSRIGLHNLYNLYLLEELKFDGMPHSTLPPPEAFPKNLKKLSFSKTRVNFEDS
ncbi:PREDICTED: putative disease resistance protein At1g50180 [Nicotiana attenuata]|uniref:Late blight resistance protein -like r1b-17 n=1 Tax=Nicotiana attenuata TaxID=49451 RepID=A0A1J6K8S1_NICAT|nr:PREDICTED: putative disease resistance protein At1g50180 [Nicotiana attenuata]OIT19259.1 putative late blight resistance protein -like r1b-17 [Nicotiana attenuata]